ncbi:MAG TPA: S8 family peptidase [Thermoanaerobaculia bacterium]|nr:S8 family peptidase [Thermoanaerobaculia bacterium]
MPLQRLPHIVLTAQPEPESFQRRGGGGEAKALPQRNRYAHAQKLLGELQKLQDEARQRAEAIPVAAVVGTKSAMHVQFEVEAGYVDALKSLEDRRKNIELVATREVGNKILATVYVPKGELKVFEHKVQKYASTNKKSGRPAHETLIAPISAIRLAALRDFWTDVDAEFPATNAVARWEIWIRDDPEAVEQFERNLPAVGVELSVSFLTFPERRVYLARGTAQQLAASVEVVDAIAELRRAKESREFFVDLRGPEAKEWVDDLLGRVDVNADPSAVCLLDSGLNAAHPLLERFTDPKTRLTARPEWGPNDQIGHGTQMAGLAVFGDLAPAVSSSAPVSVHSMIESVKILPPPPEQTPEELHGVVTRDAVNQIEITAPDRVRVFAMTITARDFRDRGQPSTWSAEVDQLAAGVEGGGPRVFVLSAGNSDTDARIAHPDHLATEQVHDPGQAWNAVTVGACTAMWEITEPELAEWRPVAEAGDLSPSTSTSITWNPSWPLKPEIVCEGGNCATDGSTVDQCHSLSLLTTSHQPIVKLFTTAGETSAACALAGRIAGAVRTRYSHFWPETVRGLLVHSAEWTETMLRRYGQGSLRQDVERRLRYCGYGEPSLERALWSASHELTLIAEAEIQPFLQDGRSDVKLNEMHVHEIPWPVDALRSLGATEVELRVTLSYFIEPNPARRGWIRRHRYASHGLRFDMQTPVESLDELRARINKLAREEDEEIALTASDSQDWVLGPMLRSKGSLHSDIWRGTATALAARRHIAVYPVGGWWKERPQLGRGNEKVRYALLVSVKTPATEVDIYTPIANAVGVAVEIESE